MTGRKMAGRRINPGPRLRRPCKSCSKLFVPRGKFCTLCDDCNPKVKSALECDWLSEENKKMIKKHKLEGYKKT